MDPITAGISALMGILGLFKNSGDKATTTSATTDPNITAMLQSQQKRTNLQDPLFEAVTRMAMGLLPKQYQRENPFDTAGGRGGQGGGVSPTDASGVGRPNETATTRVPWMRPEQPWSSPNELRRRQDNTRPAR